MFEKIEKAVFFTITRVFAWLFILPAFLALVYGGCTQQRRSADGRNAAISTASPYAKNICISGSIGASAMPQTSRGLESVIRRLREKGVSVSKSLDL